MLCPHLRECVSLTHIHTYTFKLTHTSAHLRLALAALKEQLIRAYASSAEIIKPLEGKVAELESRAAELTSALEKQQQLLEASESERKTLLGRVRQLEGREEGGENEGKGRASVGPTGGGEGGGRREEEKPPPSGGISGGEGGVGQDSKYLQDQERLRRLWVLIPQLLCACVHACMCACVHVYVQNRIFWWLFLSPSLFAAFSPLLARNLPLHDMPAELNPKPETRNPKPETRNPKPPSSRHASRANP